LKLIDEINEIDEDNKIQIIYYNLQNILIYIYYCYIKNNQERINNKITLKEICEKLEENGYNKLYEKLKNPEIFIKDIIILYENIEEKIFDNLINLLPNVTKSKLENFKNEKKNELNEYFKNENLLLSKDILIKAFKKYILRYCFCDYETEDEILKNFKIEKIFDKKDIWDNKILKDPKLKEEKDRLISLNNNKNLEQYFLYLIFIGDQEEEEETNKDEKKEDDDNKREIDNESENDDQKSQRSEDSKKSKESKSSSKSAKSKSDKGSENSDDDK